MWNNLRLLWQRITRRKPKASASSDALPEAMFEYLTSLSDRFTQAKVDHALIGGVAVVMHGLHRATKDLDFMVAQEAADAADAIMVGVGFERLQRSEVFGNYLLGPLRVDLLFTKGERSRRMLEAAQTVALKSGTMKVLRPVDLIGLKLQALANNPTRAQDRADIALLFARFSGTMDESLLRDYFTLFGKENELDVLRSTLRK